MDLFRLKDALLSECGLYRYYLWRSWDAEGKTLNIIGLNPSTADAFQDDPTIRRCIGFAKDNGFGNLYVTNLFAYRATKPNDLMVAPDPVGPENDKWLQDIATQSDDLLFAWGNSGGFLDRNEMVLELLPQGLCLGKTKIGAPRHPLYVRKDKSLEKY